MVKPQIDTRHTGGEEEGGGGGGEEEGTGSESSVHARVEPSVGILHGARASKTREPDAVGGRRTGHGVVVLPKEAPDCVVGFVQAPHQNVEVPDAQQGAAMDHLHTDLVKYPPPWAARLAFPSNPRKVPVPPRPHARNVDLREIQLLATGPEANRPRQHEECSLPPRRPWDPDERVHPGPVEVEPLAMHVDKVRVAGGRHRERSGGGLGRRGRGCCRAGSRGRQVRLPGAVFCPRRRPNLLSDRLDVARADASAQPACHTRVIIITHASRKRRDERIHIARDLLRAIKRDHRPPAGVVDPGCRGRGSNGRRRGHQRRQVRRSGDLGGSPGRDVLVSPRRRPVLLPEQINVLHTDTPAQPAWHVGIIVVAHAICESREEFSHVARKCRRVNIVI
mmetsp:Transcript_45394/g.121465  ORF Transcript_45394/g.121465 Transcript_45394/m.121465 type:complete len:393 (-) Transcript_45394:820-1998(-)